MEGRTTIHDIAKMLDVSPTTVYKALNGKPKISEETRQLILKTAGELGFRANSAAKSLARKPIRIGVVTDTSFPAFHNEVLEGARTACSELIDFNVMGEFCSITGANRGKKVIEKIDELLYKGIDGLVLSPGVDTRGYEAKILELLQKGIVTVTVVSDVISSRAFCIRYDGNMGGRMAAQLLTWIAGNREVAVFTGNNQVYIHQQTVQGFMEEAARRNLDVAAVYENQDDEHIAYYSAERMLQDFPDIGGIYINSANSVSVCKKIVESGNGRRIKIITSDIFPQLAEYIRNGVVEASIFQDPFRQGNLAFRKLYEYISGDNKCKEDILITPQILIDTNMDAFI